jgi:hypothetical protein
LALFSFVSFLPTMVWLDIGCVYLLIDTGLEMYHVNFRGNRYTRSGYYVSEEVSLSLTFAHLASIIGLAGCARLTELAWWVSTNAMPTGMQQIPQQAQDLLAHVIGLWPS